MTKIKIDIKDILNYCKCPMYYKISNSKTEGIKTMLTDEKFDIDMHNSIYSYLALMQSGLKVTIRDLNKQFATKWIGRDKTKDEILYMQPANHKDSYQAKRQRAFTNLYDFNKYLLKDKFIPVIINYKYEIPITKSITLTGTIEFVRELEDNTTELIAFKTDNNNNRLYVEKDLEITAQVYAFNTLFSSKIDKITFYGLDKNKKYHLYKSEKDFKILKYIIINVCKCIHNNIFYPSISEKCIHCLNKNKCENLI